VTERRPGQLAGFDFCCLGPHYDHQHHGAAVAARCFMEVLSAMAEDRSQPPTARS
jgi:arginase family enzyme